MEKKMNKEDYLRKKGLLPPEPLGVIYIVSRDDESGIAIEESLVWKKSEEHYGSMQYRYGNTPDRWRDIHIKTQSRSGIDGFDSYSWQYFGFLDKEAAEKKFVEEKKKFERKKLQEKENQTLQIKAEYWFSNLNEEEKKYVDVLSHSICRPTYVGPVG
jgi:hypothetical protein